MVKEIELLKNEALYGACVEDGINIPFKEGFKRDLNENFAGNQASSILISSKGRIIYSEDPFSFEINNNVLKVSSNTKIEVIEHGKSLKDAYNYVREEIMKKYDGKLDDLMFSSPQYDTWISMKYSPSDKKIIDYAKKILKNGYKPGVMIIDDSWALDYGVYTFNKVLFNDPKKMVAKLHKMGFKVMLWETPFISPDSMNFRNLEAKGALVKNKDGNTLITRWWNGYSGVLDLTNEDAIKWLEDQNKHLMDEYGIDGFKMDASDPEYYPSDAIFKQNINRAYQSTNYTKIGLKYAFNELRACYKMEGAPISQRMRDKNHSWTHEGIERLVSNAINMSLLGYFYFAPDMVGGGMLGDFEKDGFKFDEELFVRYAELACFLPMIQFSLAPWDCLNESNQLIVKNTLKIRESLMPYILSLKKEAEEKYEPMIKSLEFNYPGCGYENITDEFLLGDDILVCPVIKKGEFKKHIVVPEGRWVDDKNIVYRQGEYDVEAPIDRIIYLKRTK